MANLISLPMTFLSGVFFPREAMPELAAAHHRLPAADLPGQCAARDHQRRRRRGRYQPGSAGHDSLGGDQLRGGGPPLPLGVGLSRRRPHTGVDSHSGARHSPTVVPRWRLGGRQVSQASSATSASSSRADASPGSGRPAAKRTPAARPYRLRRRHVRAGPGRLPQPRHGAGRRELDRALQRPAGGAARRRRAQRSDWHRSRCSLDA